MGTLHTSVRTLFSKKKLRLKKSTLEECSLGSSVVVEVLVQNSSVNYEMNLMSLINSSLEHVYCSNLVPNHSLIRLIIFVS